MRLRTIPVTLLIIYAYNSLFTYLQVQQNNEVSWWHLTSASYSISVQYCKPNQTTLGLAPRQFNTCKDAQTQISHTLTCQHCKAHTDRRNHHSNTCIPQETWNEDKSILSPAILDSVPAKQDQVNCYQYLTTEPNVWMEAWQSMQMIQMDQAEKSP